MVVWHSHPFKIATVCYDPQSQRLQGSQRSRSTDVLLGFPCFLYDPANVGNLITGSSAFSKPSLYIWKFSVQFSHSVVFNSLRTHGLQHARPPSPYQLLEFTQTHVHWVGDAIQPSHPLSSLSPNTFNLSQHQGLSKLLSFLHQVAKVLEFQPQHRSSQ